MRRELATSRRSLSEPDEAKGRISRFMMPGSGRSQPSAMGAIADVPGQQTRATGLGSQLGGYRPKATLPMLESAAPKPTLPSSWSGSVANGNGIRDDAGHERGELTWRKAPART